MNRDKIKAITTILELREKDQGVLAKVNKEALELLLAIEKGEKYIAEIKDVNDVKIPFPSYMFLALYKDSYHGDPCCSTGFHKINPTDGVRGFYTPENKPLPVEKIITFNNTYKIP